MGKGWGQLLYGPLVREGDVAAVLIFSLFQWGVRGLCGGGARWGRNRVVGGELGVYREWRSSIGWARSNPMDLFCW
ncbi:hypothetical protein B005_2877 [Nocardiopsis alba ATCC BAA-2165]|uniref:Uncharacterized protein n=1 Tax=Nocardiopsis alba (strain ATCC BAA-2165 / BE74) TaxID=1205910 RepID=J7LFJ6_NOCAA|nr:hypothetical protein B005_2877 [Nocardiopsis alba ATCC BAA-2165]